MKFNKNDRVVTVLDVPSADNEENILPKGTNATVLKHEGRYVTILPDGVKESWDVYASDIKIANPLQRTQ